MKRLQKFVEEGPCGERSGRAAYAFGPDNLPQPTEGFEWQHVPSFRAGDEIMQNARLKDVFRSAIENGSAIVKIGG